jgi:hypothetical protein
MNLPLNGRIAIIDDQLDQALPLINILSKHQRPHTYFSGDYRFLPDVNNALNDIRVLFLDINLIDNQSHPDKVLKGRLIPVLQRVISEKNFPYVIIYWSRNEHEHSGLIEDIFSNDLNNRKPIGYLSADKLRFFDLDGNPAEDIDEKINELFEKANQLIAKDPAYSYLLDWENQIHLAADKTLQDVFSSYHSFNSWTDNANFLINKLGESYAGRMTFKVQTPEDKIKSSFQAFNNVFIDTLEYSTSNSKMVNCVELSFEEDVINKDSIFSVNKKLLVSDDQEPVDYSGAVTEDQNPISEKIFESLLNNSFNRRLIEDDVRKRDENKEKKDNVIDKIVNKEASQKRKEIRSTWKRIYFVVTPLCDFVQRKCDNVRVIKGVIIKAEFKSFIDDKSEAIFVSPKFSFEGEIYVIVLHFRYFFTSLGASGVKHLKPLFRVRNNFLAEVQSKLARHISRQGILFIDEN